MKHLILSIALMVAGVQLLMAQEVPDSIARDNLEKQFIELNESLDGFRDQLDAVSRDVRWVRGQVNKLNDENSEIRTSVGDLKNKTEELETSLQDSKASLNEKIDDAQNTANGAVTNLKSKTVWGIVIAVVILILLMVAVYWFGRRSKNATSTVDDVRKAQQVMQETMKKMQEESVKLDGELLGLLEKQTQSAPLMAGGTEVDHSLTLKVADEIVRIEMNLSRMDPEIKGYKQLKKAVERIKDNFRANGYEIVDMLGKPYNEGMWVDASFIMDESLQSGQRIITGITKPQINYNDVIIQRAQITVSQNI